MAPLMAGSATLSINFRFVGRPDSKKYSLGNSGEEIMFTFLSLLVHVGGLKLVHNPFSAKDVLIEFTLSNARRFYSSKGNPLALKGLKNYLP